ncbi:MAG: hypothetical protein QW607_09360 [Desulfurococcaceae archaeon]
MSSSHSTSQKKPCGDVYGDFSGLSVYRWSIEASTLEWEDKTLLRKFERKLEESLENAIVCLSYLCRNTSTFGLLYAPTWIAKKLRRSHTTSSNSYIKLNASELSWIAKCPLAKTILLSSSGSQFYTTPSTVNKLKRKHDSFLEIVNKSLASVFTKHGIKYLRIDETKLCLDVSLGEINYIVCGFPDVLYITYIENMNTPLITVVEATLSPAVKHIIRGEMVFYAIASHIHYGCRVTGLIVNPRYTYLVVFKKNSDHGEKAGGGGRGKALSKKDSVESFRKLFLISDNVDYFRIVERAEELRNKHPWICSLCDLIHMCPLGGGF